MNHKQAGHRFSKFLCWSFLLLLLLCLIFSFKLAMDLNASTKTAETDAAAARALDTESSSTASPEPTTEPVTEPTPEPASAEETETTMDVEDTGTEAEAVAEENILLFTESESIQPVLETTEQITERLAEQRLTLLENYFCDGLYWNHIGVDTSGMTGMEAAMCVTDTCCAHYSNGYVYCNVYSGTMAESFSNLSYLTQCLGYASLLSDLIFRTDAPVTEFSDFDDLRIGDHIRLVYNEHSMIVTDIDWETETVTVTEVNADYQNCQISWGRQFTKAQLYQMESYIRYFTRYE